MYMNEAVQVIRRRPVKASMPVKNRMGPLGMRSPKPNVVYVTKE
jgi:hypothetical protein